MGILSLLVLVVVGVAVYVYIDLQKKQSGADGADDGADDGAVGADGADDAAVADAVAERKPRIKEVANERKAKAAIVCAKYPRLCSNS